MAYARIAEPPITETETRFRTLFEQAPFSVQLLAVDGRTLRVNKAWEDLWQVRDGDGGKEYVLGDYNILRDPQLEAKGITPYLRRAFAGESVTIPPVVYDPAELGRPGRARWVRAHAHPIKDAHGRVREVMLIHEDVSERMRAEEELRASEQRLKQLANTIPQLAWIADGSGSFQWFNDRWYAYTGAEPGRLEGGWLSWVRAEERPEALRRWRQAVESGEPLEMTVPLRGRDGDHRPFLTLVAPLKDGDGRVVQWFGTNTDVSALRQAQEELRRAEERLRLATDAGNIGIWEWDITHDRVSWSDRLYPLHGVPPEQPVTCAQEFTRLVHPDDLGGLWQRIQAAIEANGAFSAEFRTVLPDGSVRWLSTWARVHREDDTVRMVGASISVDEYKRAEAALKDIDRRKDEFLAMLAHELRNPLAPVSSAAELLKSSGSAEPVVRRASDIIARQVRHMAELVDDLLDVSRVTRGLIELQKEHLDLNAVVRAALEQVRPLIESREHVLTTWTGSGPIWVHGDRTRLVQILVNLLNNAAKYTPARGQIELRVERRAGDVRIAVRDNGQGIDPSLLPHVFDLFTQAQRTPDRAQGGLGIGLALVRSLVTLHGGAITVHSDGPGCGSTFAVTLPLTVDARAAAPADAAAPARAANALRILIVDDNADAAETLGMLLEMAGHTVFVERDPAAALRTAAGQEPQVYILDIGLPRMDGYELARRLRERPGAAAATFIAMTGYGQPHDRARSKAAGFDHHLVKPTELRDLEPILARVR